VPKLAPNSVPSYRLHRPSGQAVVTLDGCCLYLGAHGTAASRQEYDRRIAEWVANGRRLPEARPESTISELISAFKRHAETFYANSTEAANYRDALRPLRTLYGPTLAKDFGPLKLVAVRNEMIGKGWCRTYVNRQVQRIGGFFKWAASQELISVTVHQSVSTVPAIRKGQNKDCRESAPVRAVDDVIVEATLPHLTATTRAMVQFQRLTGARPGEVCAMKIGDIDRSSEVWTYTPSAHKTQHHGKTRTVFIGPKAQKILAPFLMKLDPTAHVFSAADAAAETRQRRGEARKTPLSCGNRPGSNRKSRGKRRPSDHYDERAYNRAIRRACDAAGIEPWQVNRLRHSAATEIRKQFGLEAAGNVLGHASTKTTELYAEKSADVARHIAASIG
jgi:integrase